jgi:hypothetical protein
MLDLVTACLLLAAGPAPISAEPEPVPAPEVKTSEPASAPADAVPVPAAPATPPAATPEEPSSATAAPAPATSAASPTEVSSPADGFSPKRVTLSLGLGRSYPGGSVQEDVPMNDLTSPMGTIQIQFGVRFLQRWMASLVLDASGGGSPGGGYRLACSVGGIDCTATSARVAIEGRYYFSPAAKRTWWAGAGLGSEATRILPDDGKDAPAYLPTYTGGLFPRLSGGWESRVNTYFGWGFYAALSSGRYDRVSFGESNDSSKIPGDVAGHSWLDLGVRAILFP